MSASSTPSSRAHDLDAAAGDEGLSRRSVTRGIAWSLPIVAAAAATPLAAASTLCSTTISTSSAVFSRISATSALFTWIDLFGDGKDFTLTLSAVHNGASNMTINTTNNFLLDSSQQGGESQPSVRLSLDTVDLRNIGGGERVTFSFALNGAPVTVTDLSYKIKDVDGFQAQDGRGGTERVSVTAGTGTYNSTWVQGQGTGADPWRPSTTAPNVEVVPGSTAGNVTVAAASVSAFDLTFIGNNSGRAGTDRPNQNIWVGPFTFTVQDPVCAP
ncbi:MULTISPECIES: hypothetical protein [unclassified Microbacterium]|uniref:hypothetical protein n=1 Tax=unclassified Microbacterium TaxID=2609290 RepID=UPI0012FC054B|nr:hypothetical protein [Microbacterium sp. MAH-37]MVQ41463.1 hypothetical protein [Microbacterium sp. MAH-37]